MTKPTQTKRAAQGQNVRKPHRFAVGEKVRDIYTGEMNTVKCSYWQNYAGGNTADYTVEFEPTEAQPTGWNKSTNLETAGEARQPVESTQSSYWQFERFMLEITDEAVADCSHQGDCDEDVAYWSRKIVRPEEATPEVLRNELQNYGAWDEAELADDEANWQRIIWIMAGNIKEENWEAHRQAFGYAED